MQLKGAMGFSQGGKKVQSYLDYEEFELLNNTLELKTTISSQLSNITLFANSLAYDISPAYILNNQAYYLWDMRAGIPDSADLCGRQLNFNFEGVIPPATELSYFHEDFKLSFTKRDLYDTLFLRYHYALNETSEQFHFQNEATPVRSWVKMTLNPKLQYPMDKSAVYTLSSKGSLGYVGGKWNNGAITFATRDLTKYTIATDTIAPSIKLKKSNRDIIEFYIGDDMSGIKSYRGEINGEWLLLKYDYKRDLLQSEKKINIPFQGEFILTVSDNAGNEEIYTTKIQ